MESLSEDGYTLAHISHLHDLHLTDVPAPAAGATPPPRCHACGLDCAGSAYQCAPCRYALHPECARVGRTVRHPAHPEHPLSLRLATPAPYQSGIYTCDACRTGGHEFVLHCHLCRFDLHLPCAALPVEVPPSRAHPQPHPLRLAYCRGRQGQGQGQGEDDDGDDDDEDEDDEDEEVVVCGVCKQGIIAEQWFYECEQCGGGDDDDDFAAHVGCAVPGAAIKVVYPRIDMAKPTLREISRARAAERQAQGARNQSTAALLQQYQQMSALVGAQSSAFARNTASMLNANMHGLNLGARMSRANLANNFN